MVAHEAPRLGREDLAIGFCNDAEAAIVAEALHGAGRPFERVLGITLGAGLGACLVAGDAIVESCAGVVPGELYRQSFGIATADDAFSDRGLRARLGGADPASTPDADALGAFAAFGADLAPWTDILSAVAFFLSALFLWFKEPEPIPEERAVSPGWWRAAIVSFASILLTEWGDPSQIAVAALTVKFHSSLATWLGGTLAMTAKGGLAIVIGVRLSGRLPQRTLRALATASCCVLGILALSGIVFH